MDKSEQVLKDIVSEMIMSAAFMSEKFGYSLDGELKKVIDDLYRHGTSLDVLLEIDWPDHIATVIGEILYDYGYDLEGLGEWRDGYVGIDLTDEGEERTRRYFVRPRVETEEATGIDLD